MGRWKECLQSTKVVTYVALSDSIPICRAAEKHKSRRAEWPMKIGGKIYTQDSSSLNKLNSTTFYPTCTMFSKKSKVPGSAVGDAVMPKGRQQRKRRDFDRQKRLDDYNASGSSSSKSTNAKNKKERRQQKKRDMERLNEIISRFDELDGLASQEDIASHSSLSDKDSLYDEKRTEDHIVSGRIPQHKVEVKEVSEEERIRSVMEFFGDKKRKSAKRRFAMQVKESDLHPPVLGKETDDDEDWGPGPITGSFIPSNPIEQSPPPDNWASKIEQDFNNDNMPFFDPDLPQELPVRMRKKVLRNRRKYAGKKRTIMMRRLVCIKGDLCHDFYEEHNDNGQLVYIDTVPPASVVKFKPEAPPEVRTRLDAVREKCKQRETSFVSKMSKFVSKQILLEDFDKKVELQEKIKSVRDMSDLHLTEECSTPLQEEVPSKQDPLNAPAPYVIPECAPHYKQRKMAQGVRAKFQAKSRSIFSRIADPVLDKIVSTISYRGASMSESTYEKSLEMMDSVLSRIEDVILLFVNLSGQTHFTGFTSAIAAYFKTWHQTGIFGRVMCFLDRMLCRSQWFQDMNNLPTKPREPVYAPETEDDDSVAEAEPPNWRENVDFYDLTDAKRRAFSEDKALLSIKGLLDNDEDDDEAAEFCFTDFTIRVGDNIRKIFHDSSGRISTNFLSFLKWLRSDFSKAFTKGADIFSSLRRSHFMQHVCGMLSMASVFGILKPDYVGVAPSGKTYKKKQESLSFKGIHLMSYKLYDIQKETGDFIECALKTVIYFGERLDTFITTGDWSSIFLEDSKATWSFKEYNTLCTVGDNLESGALECISELWDEKFQVRDVNDYQVRLVALRQYFAGVHKLAISKKDTWLANSIEQKIGKLTAHETNVILKLKQQTIIRKPMVCMIHGSSSIGKTTFCAMLRNAIGKGCNFKTGPEYTAFLSEQDKFDSTIHNYTTVAVYDDYGNAHPDRVEGLPTRQIIEFANNSPRCALKAEAHEKGKVFPKLDLMLITTNVADLHCNVYSVEPASVMRRVDLYFFLKLKPEYVSRKGELNSDLAKICPDMWEVDVKECKIVPGTCGAKDTYKLITVLKSSDVSEVFDLAVQHCRKHRNIQSHVVDSMKRMNNEEVCEHWLPRHSCKRCNPDICKQLEDHINQCPRVEPEAEDSTEDFVMYNEKDFVASSFEEFEKYCPIDLLRYQNLMTSYHRVCDRLKKCTNDKASFAISRECDRVLHQTEECYLEMRKRADHLRKQQSLPLAFTPEAGIFDMTIKDVLEEAEVKKDHACDWVISGLLRALLMKFLYREWVDKMVPNVKLLADEDPVPNMDTPVPEQSEKPKETIDNGANAIEEIMATGTVNELDVGAEDTSVDFREYLSSFIKHVRDTNLLTAVGEFVAIMLSIFSIIGLFAVFYKMWQSDSEEIRSIAELDICPEGAAISYVQDIGITDVELEVAKDMLQTKVPNEFLYNVNKVPEDNIWTPVNNQVLHDHSNANLKGWVDTTLVDKVSDTTAIARKSKGGGWSNIVPLQGNLWLFPAHFLGDSIYALEITRIHKGKVTVFNGAVGPSDMYRLDKYDLIVVCLSFCTPGANNFDRMPKDMFVPTHHWSGTLSRFNSDKEIKRDLVKFEFVNDVVYELTAGISRTHIGYQYECSKTGSGACGGQLVKMGKNPCLIGFHVAGSTNSPTTTFGLASPVFQDMFQEAITFFGSKGKIGASAGNMPTSAYGIKFQSESDIHPKHCLNWLSQEKVGEDYIMPTVECYGMTGQRTSFRSSVKVFKNSKLIEKHLKLPRQHGPPKERREWVHYRRDLISSACINNYVNPEIVETITNDMKDHWRNTIPDEYLKKNVFPLGYDYAINGIAGVAGIDALKWNTSMGHPINQPKKRFVEDMEELPGVPDPKTFAKKHGIRSMVEHIIATYRRRERFYPIFKACLKDEARPLESEKVRVFNSCPVAFSILFRHYFLPIISSIHHHNFDVGSAVGTNCFSRQWTRLARMLRKHKNVFAGDYKSFDKRMSPAFLTAAYRILIDLAKRSGNYSEDDILVMEMMVTDLIYPMMEYDSALIMLFGSNVSGNNATVDINSIVNELYMRYAFAVLCKNRGLSRKFEDFVYMIAYGDDNIVNVSDQVPFFNFENVRKVLLTIGVIYTLPDKTDRTCVYMHYSHIDFLKRKFVWNEEHQMFMAPLEMKSISKSLHTYVQRENDLTEDQLLCQIIDTNIREFLQHGREVYDEKMAQLGDFLTEAKLDIYFGKLPTYEETFSKIYDEKEV